jgi:site-specific recombinase XerD
MITTSPRKVPRTLTKDEQSALMKETGTHRSGFRDHVIFSLALGTALREHELISLNVGDVLDENGKIRRRFPLRVFKRSNKDQKSQEAILPDKARYKVEKFIRWKRHEGESLNERSPLFISRQGGGVKRLSARMLRPSFGVWQRRAGFERKLNFHALRHTALSNLYADTKDIRLVQIVARHSNVETTTIYATVSDEEVLRAVRVLNC